MIATIYLSINVSKSKALLTFSKALLTFSKALLTFRLEAARKLRLQTGDQELQLLLGLQETSPQLCLDTPDLGKLWKKVHTDLGDHFDLSCCEIYICTHQVTSDLRGFSKVKHDSQ